MAALTGELVAEARARAGITQEELARRLGTKSSVISRWETGRHSISLERLEAVAAACDLELVVALKPSTGEQDWPPAPTSYAAVHNRLRCQRGSASGLPCSACGEPASEWAFDQPRGYSTDLTRYRPLCVPCHRLADKAVV